MKLLSSKSAIVTVEVIAIVVLVIMIVIYGQVTLHSLVTTPVTVNEIDSGQVESVVEQVDDEVMTRKSPQERMDQLGALSEPNETTVTESNGSDEVSTAEVTTQSETAITKPEAGEVDQARLDRLNRLSQ